MGRPFRIYSAPHPVIRLALLGWMLLGYATAGDAALPGDAYALLRAHCLKCHGVGEKIKGGLDIASRAGLLRGGETGSVFDPTQPAKNRLLDMLSHRDDDHRMPPAGKLKPEQIALFERWLLAGAPFPADAPTVARPLADKPPLRPHSGSTWWAWQPLRPVTPPGATADDAIDAFISASWQTAGVTPAPLASRATLIRRATYDLIGLPPTPDEVAAFVADRSPQAYDRLLDRLLASPHYGEKWGRHWLDLMRYAETNGYERDGRKAQVWRYRDYVVASFNADKPYDRFLREHIAGDEITPRSAEALIATGWYRLGLWDDEPADRPQAQADARDDIVATAAQVFLGLTVNCARCHDHKGDPIPQRDYYRLSACFADVPYFDNPKSDKASGSMLDLGDLLPADPGGKRPFALGVRALDKAMSTHVLARGNPGAPGELVEPGTPSLFAASVIPSGKGRRTALAEWIASTRQPLAARVMANRIWQQHFGRGIVPTPSDFGALGEKPSHPELLDWLANDLVAGGWTFKRLHQRIMRSAAYRRAAIYDGVSAAKDPGNQWWWRFDLRRLAAEEVRDSLLVVSGRLDPTLGGVSIFTDVPAAVLATASRPGDAWKPSPAEQQRRRSLYVHVMRSLPEPHLAAFDLPDTDASCPARFATTVPTQALTSLNSAFFNRQAAHLAGRLAREAPADVAAQGRLGLRLVCQREPSAAETQRFVALVATLKTAGSSPDAALAQACLALINLNEFMHID